MWTLPLRSSVRFKLIEAEERVVEGALEMAVVDSSLLVAVCRAEQGIQIEDQRLYWVSPDYPINPRSRQINEYP